MAFVVNDTVKMEWEKRHFLQAKAGGQKGKSFFIVAAKEYETASGGKIPVFFNPTVAFLWISDPDTADEDRWTIDELIGFVKSEYSARFPLQYDEYIPLADADGVEAGTIEKYGLGAHADDIIARINDLAPYGVEVIAE